MGQMAPLRRGDDPVAENVRVTAPASSYPYGSYEAVLARLRGDGLSGVLSPPVEVETLELLRRPYSKLARIRLRHRDGVTEAFVKLLRLKEQGDAHREAMRDRVVKEFEVASAVHQTYSAHGWPSVRPLTCVADELALVTERAEGEELLAVLEREATWYPSGDCLARLCDLLSSSGEWILRFQALRPSGGIVSLDSLREYLDVRLRRLVQHDAARFSPLDRSRLLQYFDDKCRDVTPADLREVWVHADFGPSNVLVSGSHVVVLDFAMTHQGTQFNDLARMYTQLEALAAKPQFRMATVVRLQRALLEGYQPGLTSAHPLFDLLVLQNRITHLLMTVVRDDAGVLARVYNWHLARRSRRWVRELIATKPRSGSAGSN